MPPVTSKFFDSPAATSSDCSHEIGAAVQESPQACLGAGEAVAAEECASGRTESHCLESRDPHSALDRFAYAPRPGAKSFGLPEGVLYGDDDDRTPTPATAPATARFTSPMVRAGSFSSSGARLSIRPQLPSTRPRAVSVMPERLELLAFRRS